MIMLSQNALFFQGIRSFKNIENSLYVLIISDLIIRITNRKNLIKSMLKNMQSMPENKLHGGSGESGEASGHMWLGMEGGITAGHL